MKTIIALLSLNLVFAFSAQADVLPPAEADAICHAKALNAAHFLAETNKKFIVTYVAATEAEISTMITYQYRFEGSTVPDAVYTVVAYAYPDDKSCTIGSVTNDVAGND